MSNHWFYSLRFRLLIAIVAILLILFGSAIFNTNRLLNDFALKNTQAIIKQTSEILNLAIVPHTTESKLEELKYYLNELIRNDGQAIVYLALIDDQKRILVATPDTPHPLPDASTDQLDKELFRGLIHVSQPILLAHNRVGHLQFGFSTKRIIHARHEILLNNIGLLIGGLLVSLTLMSTLSITIGKQLGLLIDASKALADGKHDVRAFEAGKNELCDLAHNFNLMADAITKRTVELQSSEGKLSAMFYGARDGILMADLETGRIADSNPSLCAMIGYSRDELLNSDIQSIHHPNDTSHIRALLTRLSHGEILMPTEIRVLRRNSDSFPAEMSVSLLEVNGKSHIAAFFRDITDRKQTEIELENHRNNLETLVAERTAKLEEITTYYRTLFETSPIGLLLYSPDGHLIETSPSFLSIIGYNEVEAKALSFSTITPSEYEHQDQLILETLEQKGRYGPYEKEIFHKQGYKVPVRMNGTLVHQGDQTFIWASVENITDEKNKQRQLETIIDNLPTVFFIKDTQGRHQLVNRRFEEITGISKAQAIGRTDKQIFTPELGEQIMQMDQTILAKKEIVTFEEQHPHVDGTLHTYLTTKVPMADAQGKVSTLLGLGTDITQLKQLQNELSLAKDQAEHLTRIKSEFLANMSHEIRTPLNAVLGLAKIGSRDSEDMRSREIFEHILSSGQHLLGLLNDVLDLSKLEAGKLIIEKSSFHLENTVDHIIDLVTEQARAKGLALSAFKSYDLPIWVDGDPLRLRQILLNILSNAIKFTNHGLVKLDISRRGEIIDFGVTDSGIGITPEQIAHLFKPFEQGDNSISRQFGGTGLGLAICHNLAHLMEGNIKIESEVGRGSIFTLSLPLPETQPGIETNTYSIERRSLPLQRLRILVAEDIEMNRYILEDILKHEGAYPTFADNGKEALEYIKRMGGNAFDIILMDIQMPTMDGYEATRQIKSIAPNVPIIGLSAHALIEEKQRSLKAGMVDHVSKPIDTDILVDSILKHLNNVNSHSIPSSPPPLANTSPMKNEHDIPPESLPGIDIASGLKRCLGRWPFYKKMLLLFYEQYHSSAETIKTYIEQNAFDDGRKLSHSIKGTAGNIGAMQLNKDAAALEQAFKANNGDEIARRYQSFSDSLNEVISSLKSLA